MCGIAGAIGYLDDRVLQAVRRIDLGLAHRGPDDKGFWQSSQTGPGVAFAQRRLAIIDLRPEAAQPMHDETTGNVIVFNGEIYNFQELRDTLASEGVTYRTKGDTEVILKAYARWGEDCVSRFRGMYAFVLWDAKNRRCFMARDHVGEKPLYWARTTGADGRPLVLFASELHALVDSGMVDRSLDPAAVSSYLWNGFVVGPTTVAKGVKLLPAASTCIITAEGEVHGPNIYWRLPKANGKTATAEEVQERLRESVRMRLVSDVPVGVFLSGGVDSSLVATLASDSVESSVRTFTVGFPNTRHDESRYAGQIAKMVGSEHTELAVSPETFRSMLPTAMDHMDQPTFDYVNTYIVSRAAREAGITVALSGLGGDEIFGGYTSFSDVPKIVGATRILSPVPSPVLQWVSKQALTMQAGKSGIPSQTRWGKFWDALTTRGSLVDAYQARYSLFTSETRNLLAPELKPADVHSGLPDAKLSQLDDILDGEASLHAVSTLELACYVGERLLRDTDVASMAVAIEVRVPLLDIALLETVARMDSAERFQPLGKKNMLRNAMRHKVDPSTFDRPKTGFELPLNEWCLQELHRDMEDAFSDTESCRRAGLHQPTVYRLWQAFQSRTRAIYWTRIWALYVLLHWCRRNNASL